MDITVIHCGFELAMAEEKQDSTPGGMTPPSPFMFIPWQEAKLPAHEKAPDASCTACGNLGVCRLEKVTGKKPTSCGSKCLVEWAEGL